MNKRILSCLMFAALMGTAMVSVTSCADYSEDINTLQHQVNDNVSVTNALQSQVDGMQSQITALQESLKAMKSCNCGDVDARIAEQISKALAGLNYATPEQVADAIKKALESVKTGLTEEEVQALIVAYHNANPDCQCGDIEALIKEYLKNNPGLTEGDVTAIVEAYYKAHPASSLTESDVKSIVETYINQLQHFTKEEIEGMINTAIAQALANYVSCTCDSYSKSQIEALIKSAIEAYAATDGHGLTEEQVNALIDKAVEAAIKGITHPESGLSEAQVNALIAKAIEEALKSVDAKIQAATAGLASKTYVEQLIEAAKCNCPGITAEEVSSIAASVIEQYMKDHPYTLDEDAVKNIANSAIANSQVINDIQASITTLQTTVNNLNTEIQNLKNGLSDLKGNVYTKTEVEALANALIQQAIAGLGSDKTLSAEQQAIVDQLIAAAIDSFAKAHPDCNCMFDADAFNALVAEVAKNAAAIAAIEVPDVSNFVSNEALQQAIQEVKNLIPESADLSNYVTIATLNAAITEANTAIAAAETKAASALAKAGEALTKADEALGSANANAVAITNLENSVKELRALYVELDKKVDEALRKANSALDRSLSNYFDIQALDKLYKDLLASMPEEYDDSELRGAIQQLEIQLANMASKDDLKGLATVEDVKKAADKALADAKTYADQAASLAAASALADAKKYTNTEIGKLKKLYEAADELLQGQIDDINLTLGNIDTALAGLQSQIDDLKKVSNYVNKLITSIELQGTVNPTFGYFSLPIGVTSNVLIAYYGENEHKTDFPALDDYDLVYTDSENWITAEDFARLGTKVLHWNGGSTLVNSTGNAGKIYLTVNPSSVDFTGTKFSLVNSLGEESPVTLGNLEPCTDKITFGQTRATATNSFNGFYEASATVDKKHLDDAKFTINKQLTDALEQIAKDRQAQNISSISQAIYNQFNGVLDAYAVQATWTDDSGTHTVTSKYGIAATAIKPLSYNALMGLGFTLPTISPLSAYDIDLKKYFDPKSFNFTIPAVDISLGEIKVDFSDLYIEDDCVYSDVTVTNANNNYEKVKVMIVDASGHYHNPSGSPEDMELGAYNEAVAKYVVTLLNDRANTWSAQLAQEFTSKLADSMSQIQAKVDDAVASVNGQLQGTISGLLDSVQDKLNSVVKTADKFIAQLNNLIGKFNGFISNPNLRLQSQLYFEDANGFLRPMSTAKGIPSVVKGDGEGIELNISSPTGEVLAPAFKKFVAVTNVYKDGKDADSDPALMNALKTANSVEYFNKVITGDRYAVVFHPDNKVKGATYEIVYSALDFQGKISQRKYYVKVN